jgi:hypothetical protein
MIPGRPCDAQESEVLRRVSHALADEGGGEDGSELRVLIRPGEAPIAGWFVMQSGGDEAPMIADDVVSASIT